MHLTATNIREVAQTFSSATSEWGLGREHQVALSVLRVRIGLGCPEDNLRKLMWHSNPNHGVVRETTPKKELSLKLSNATRWPLACSQNKGLHPSEYQRRASQLHLGPSLRRGREASVWQPEPEGNGLVQSLPQRPHLPPSLTRLSIANHVFLRSWVFHIFYECHSLRAAPRGDIRHTWDCALVAHPGNQAAGTGEVYKMHDPPERVCSPSTWLPEGLDLGRAQNSQPTGSVPLWSTGEPEWLRPGKFTKCRGHLRQHPCRMSWSLSSVDPGSTHSLGLWQTQCGPSTTSTLHTCQKYLFVVFLPPHSTTEQVSLNKQSLHPLVSGWKLETEETCNRGRQNKERGMALGVIGATD